MKKLPFTKMHGIGNDFVIINTKDILALKINLDNNFVQKICNRNFGIGSDGLLILDISKKADFKYKMYNPDGSVAEMCGNGIRCFMKYLLENKITNKNKISVETGAGILFLEKKGDEIVVDMGTPKFDKKEIGVCDDKEISGKIISKDREFEYTSVSMGNPHSVIFIDEKIKDFNLDKYGAPIEGNVSYFKNKINVEFVEKINNEEINFRVYERGAGETLACGTGACGAVAVGVKNGLLKAGKEIKVNLAGGILHIKWSGELEDSVIMRGPAETSFEGIYYTEN